MRKRAVYHWESIADLDGLRFFTQRLEELLFDYTLDTYKFSALNTCFLCIEAAKILQLVEESVIEEKHLEFVLEELNWSFSEDEVAKSILGKMHGEYFPLNDIQNKKAIKIKLEILLNKLSPDVYLIELEKLLIDAVEKKQKKRINYLSGSYITTLINIGYQKNYIHFRLRKLFFDKRRPINSLETLNDFFDEFDLELKDYKVIFKGSKLLNEIKDSCQSFDITITDDFAFEGPNGKGFANQKTEDEVFVICDEISALDGIAAKVNAERKIGRIVNLFTYFHHKEVPHWSNDAIVIRNGLEHPVKKHTSPMVKIPDMRPGKAAKDLNEVLKNFNLESRSLKKFNRAFDLHGLAVSGEEVENQILNTWIAFETMIDGKDGGSKIQQISDAIVPFINLFYLRNIINYTYQSLRRWNIAFIRELLSKVPDSKNGLPQDKVAMIIACEEFKDLRTELLAELESFILLRFRVWQLSEVLKNGKSIRVFIEQHTTKVIWHIRRIYRARNLIVHEGTIDPNIDILAENAHSYLDSFMNGIIYLSAYDRHIITINQGIKESNILYHFWQKTLKNNEKTKCSVDNYALFLFGE